MVKSVTKKAKTVRFGGDTVHGGDATGGVAADKESGRKKGGNKKENKSVAKGEEMAQEAQKVKAGAKKGKVDVKAIAAPSTNAVKTRPNPFPKVHPSLLVPVVYSYRGQWVVLQRVINPVWQSGLWVRRTVNFHQSYSRRKLPDDSSDSDDESDVMSIICDSETMSTFATDDTDTEMDSSDGESQDQEEALEVLLGLKLEVVFEEEKGDDMDKPQYVEEPSTGSATPPSEDKPVRRSARTPKPRKMD